MIGIVPHFFKIVMLSTYPDTLLRINRPFIRSGTNFQKNILELIHPGIGKQKGGIVLRHYRCTGNKGVTFIFKKPDKILTYFFRCLHNGFLQFSNPIKRWQSKNTALNINSINK